MSAWDDILRGLDPVRQLPAVMESGSAVVSAGAGSGKTRVLAVRYLYLVKERHIPPERILCMTFTKKAAAEMSERIRGMLMTCAADDEDFARALEAFPTSRVSTLDSFCSELARNGCSRWGVPPDFAVDKAPDSDAIDALAIDFLLERRNDPIAASFIAASGFQNAVDALASLAGGREGLVGSDRRFDAASQAAAIASCLTATHERLHELLKPGVDLDPGALKGALAWRDIAVRFPGDTPEPNDIDGLALAAATYRQLAALHLATGKAEAALYYNVAGKAARPLALVAALACEALLDKRRSGALDMLRDFLALAVETRTGSGSLTFSDVAAIALRTLETDLSLRDWYKSRYDAIMVDEFQDDNDLQKRILYCLAESRDRVSPDRGPLVGPAELEPGVLFFVGDEKQSIYAFRGADVTVFRGLADELSAAPGAFGAHSLDINWRSEPGLIEFFNDSFSRILPAPDDSGAKGFEARFSGLESGPPTPGVKPEVVYLESSEPDDNTMMPSGEAEAWRIAELVRSLVDDGAIVAAKGADGRKIARPCRWDDIAILFRSTASQNVVERYLRLLGVPYSAASTAGLFAESILGDLYAMMRLAIYPDDRLAFAAVLRGPFARLSDDAAYAALSSVADTRGPDGLMGFDTSALSGADATRFRSAHDCWQGVRELADRQPLRRVIEYLWYERGLRWNVLKDPASASFLEHFDYAWSLAAAADARGERLVDFVAALEPKIGKLDRFDEAVLRESSRGVSIMTVHMSKGLEYPIVIMPDIDSKGRGDTRSPIASSGPFGPSVRLLDEGHAPRDPIAELAAEMRKIDRGDGDDAMDESIAETARLFYVACTRAISRLYLVGKVPRSADALGRSFRGLFIRAWPWAGPTSVSDEEFLSDRPDDAPGLLSVEYVPERSKTDYGRLSDAAGPDGAERAKASAKAPNHAVAERRGRWSVTGAAAFLEDRARAGAAASGARLTVEPGDTLSRGEKAEPGLSEADFGTLCHQLVEIRLREPDVAAEPRGVITKAFARLSASAASRDLGDALYLADRFIASPRGIAASAARDAVRDGIPGSVFEIEYPFVWSGPVILSGSMDLVFSEAGKIIVIDFKTDRRPDPDKHAFQLSVYRDAAESIFGVPTQAFVLFMRTGAEHEISGVPDASGLGVI